MKKILFCAAVCGCVVSPIKAEDIVIDSAKVIDIEEIVIVGYPKEHSKLRQSPTAVSLFSPNEIDNLHVESLKNLSNYVPNFFMSDYGSRLTSSIYIRGIGSRLNTPAVGLYVDNMPYIEKSTYDLPLLDIERIDVLRGPQGTLYGRNTMGGLIKAYTRNPMYTQGTDIRIGGATKNAERYISINTNQRVSDKVAFSLGAFYKGDDGFFRNNYTGSKMDGGDEGGGRARLIFQPNSRLTFDLNANYTYSDEQAYPYIYRGTANATSNPETAETEALIGQISANRTSSYYRSLFNAGLNVKYAFPNATLTSVTSYQNLKDHMSMDQDFLRFDIFSIDQMQRANTVTEELIVKSRAGRRWQWTTGVFGLYQTMKTDGPVNFYADGMKMLNTNINHGLDAANAAMAAANMSMALNLTRPSMLVDGTFKTPILNGAIFHQSTLRDLLGLRGLSFTLGLRLDYEHLKLDYNSACGIDYNFYINRKLPTGAMIPVMTLPDQRTVAEYVGDMQDDYTQLLPKFALQYDFENQHGNVYATVTKGFRSGGYNIQMFSDLLQSCLRNNMMTDVMAAANMTGRLDVPANPTARETVVYKPEYSWNYEVGSHLNLFENQLQIDLAAFFLDTYDQQISRYAESGLGRQMLNAGHSQSYGAEASLRAALFENRLTLGANYGYTHATFKDYDDGELDYSGNYVPFVPQHTMGAMADYRFPIHKSWLYAITLGANANGAGSIYWTETNNVCQNFYATLGAHLTADFGKVEVNFWGKNLTNSHYDTFYFESMNRGFAQACKPLQVGVDVHVRL